MIRLEVIVIVIFIFSRSIVIQSAIEGFRFWWLPEDDNITLIYFPIAAVVVFIILQGSRNIQWTLFFVNNLSSTIHHLPGTDQGIHNLFPLGRQLI